MSTLRVQALAHSNGTSAFTIGTNGVPTWNNGSGVYVQVSPSGNIWFSSITATVDGTFTLGPSSAFPSVPTNAVALHCTCTTHSSDRQDHMVHLIGGGLHATGGISWDVSDSSRRKGSFQIQHEGDSSYPGSFFGNSETGIIRVETNGTFAYRFGDGYNAGSGRTNYITVTCFGYWV